MKKIIILLAILACGVGQAGAQITESGYMKVYVQNKLKIVWDKIILHHWGYNSSRVAADVNEEATTEVIDGITWHVFKLPISLANNAPFLVYNGSWHNTTDFSSNLDSDGSIYGDTFFDLNQDSESSKPYLTRQSRFYLYNTATQLSTKLATADFSTYTLTFDNSDNSLDGYYAIAANYAFKDKGDGSIKDWANNAFRPQSSGDLDVAFANYSNQDAPRAENGGVWHFDKSVIYDITFTPGSWSDAKWSVRPYFTRNINSIGYSTFSSDYAVAIPEGVTAYYASEANSSTKKVTMTKFENGIAANTGALLYKSGGDQVTFTPATSTDNVSGSNLLKPTTGSDIYNSSKAQYVLAKAKNSNDVSTIAFKKVGSSYSPAKGSAYLEVNSALAPSFEIFFDDAAGGTTAIDAVKSAEPAVTDGAYYNLAGQRVTNPTKGLYIVNGRKVVVK